MPNDTNYFLFQALSRSFHGLDEDDHHFSSKDDKESPDKVASGHSNSEVEQEIGCQRDTGMEDTKQNILAELIEAIDSASPGSRERRSPRSLPSTPQTSWHTHEPENISRSLTNSPVISRKPPLPPTSRRGVRRFAGIRRRPSPSHGRRGDGPISQLFRRLQNDTNQQVPAMGSLQGTSAPISEGIMQQVPSIPNSDVGRRDGGAHAQHARPGIGSSVLCERQYSEQVEEDQR